MESIFLNIWSKVLPMTMTISFHFSSILSKTQNYIYSILFNIEQTNNLLPICRSLFDSVVAPYNYMLKPVQGTGLFLACQI